MAAVFGNYDQAGLDAQYNNRAMVPDYPAYLARWQADSEIARKTLAVELDIAYGKSDAERLDVFRAVDQPRGAPVLVFIHGGYWQALDKRDFDFVARAYVAAGVTVVVVNYALTPTVSMDEIVRQTRASLAWTWQNARRFGGDPGRIHVTGHSAGGHLTAALLVTNWPTLGLPADPIAGAVAISGLYELEPIRLSYLNQAIRLDADAARRNSPIFAVQALEATDSAVVSTAPGKLRSAPLTLAVGQKESDEFHRQQRSFAAAWLAAGRPVQELDLPGRNHFSVLDAFCDPNSALFRATLEQIQRPTA